MYCFPSNGWFFSCKGFKYDDWAPCEVTLAVAARLAKKMLFSRSLPLQISAAITPTNAPPAPSVLTVFTVFAAICLTTEPFNGVRTKESLITLKQVCQMFHALFLVEVLFLPLD